MPRPTDIRVREVTLSYEEFHYRTPIKFGGVALDRATNLDVRCVVETVAGKTARGFGSMPLGNVSKPYHCSLHPSMVGSLNEAQTPEPPPCTGYCG